MITGKVQVALVPMIFTFDENEVEYVAETLGNSIQEAYEIMDLFGSMAEEVWLN